MFATRIDGFRRLTIGLLIAAAICLAGSLLGVMQAQAGSRDGQPGVQATQATQHGAAYAPGEVLVRMRDGATKASTNALAGALGAAGVRDLGVRAILPQGERILLLKSSEFTGEALVKAALQNPDVEAASLNYTLYADSATPNDPRFSELWGLNNTGQTGGTTDADIDAPEAWSFTTGGSGVVVADIDTGVAYDHLDLAANMWHNPGETPGNGIDDDGNGYVDDVYGIDAVNGDSDPYDDHGHGTHTSGTIAAVGNNGIGISGVAWQARVMALKFLNASGSGSTSGAITCINYVVGEKLNHGVNVVAINASWGGGAYSDLLRDAINAAGTANIIFCAAAGNGGADGIGDDNDAAPQYPASYDCANIISVAATDASDAQADFSNYGATSVDLAAPGVGILSTIPGSTFAIDPGGPFYDTMESGPGGWTAQSPWAVTTEQAFSPTHSWSDSPSGNYANNANVAITTPVVNLSAASGQYAFGFSVKGHLETNWDYLYVEFSNDSGATWRGVGSLTGGSDGSAWAQFHWSIPADMKVATFRARLRLGTDETVTYDGVYVDNVGFGSLSGSNAYDSWNGTSMATPHVTGAVALCAAQFPSETAAQRKQRILAAVDPIASMTGKCVTGGRLNAAGCVSVLTVTAPNGGEAYAAGSMQTASWNAPGQTSGVYGVWAVSEVGGTHTWLGQQNVVAGQTSYSLPWYASPPPGDYRVRVSYGFLPATWLATDYSDATFTIVATPTVTGFTPTSGPIGAEVVITGTDLTGATVVAFNGTAATVFTVNSATQITATTPAGATSGTIAVTTPGGTATSAASFTVIPAPTVTGFTPTSGPAGTAVTVAGTGFTSATAVAFNGTAAAAFTVSSATQITTTVPAGATTGKVAVTTPNGTGVSATNFTVTTPLAAPAVTGFTPTSGPVGTAVTLTGTGFSGASAVAFNGTPATVFTVNSATQITATVPIGATSGTIAVTTPGGSAASAVSFTVIPAPTLTPELTLKLGGLKKGALTLGKRVTAKGTVTPTSFAGGKVALTVQKKKGATWVRVTKGSATITATGAYSWKYKPAKKGSYRLRAAIAGADTTKTKWVAFKVK